VDIKEFKEIIFDEAKKYNITDFELFYQKDKSFKVSVFDGKIEKYYNNLSGGVSFKAIIKGKTGYAYSERIDRESVDFLLESVMKNSEITNDEGEYIYCGDENYPEVNVFNEKLDDYDTNFKIKLCKDIEKAALNYDKRIVSVESCIVGNDESEVYIANSKNLELFKRSNYANAYVSVTAEENGVRKTGGEFWHGMDFGPIDYVQIAEIACRKALSMLGGKPVRKGVRNIIFKNEAFADILTTFMDCFFAENSQKGFSLLKGKVGEQIAAECVTIKDMPLLEGGFATCGFDSEGVASYNKTIVEEGKLNTFLYNLKSAAKDNIKSTGNGFKSSFKEAASTAATNFILEKGEAGFDELVFELYDGLIITSLAGLHSGAEPVSGNFSLAAEGFLVEKGKVTAPVEQITISGNFFDVLKDISDISDDLFFDTVTKKGAVICPSVLVKNINVAS